jgi:putative acetyltransferase
MEGIIIRPIIKADNKAIAHIIRQTLEEFNANKPGTVYFDASTDHLFELFQSNPRSIYYITELDNEIRGGAGIFPTANLPEGVCELVKIYLSKELRGAGLGKIMIAKCLESAKQNGFTKVYLETMPELKMAVKIYEKLGFKYLSSPMGKSGHNDCSIWMIKEV